MIKYKLEFSFSLIFFSLCKKYYPLVLFLLIDENSLMLLVIDASTLATFSSWEALRWG